jgi:vacuolar-type H+-ATPase subunit E/Vma4
VALADIINRIETQAREEAERIEQETAARVAAIRADAERSATQQRDAAVVKAGRQADAEAATVIAAAKLAVRDGSLARKRALVDEAIAGVVEAIKTLPDDRYVRFLAARIAATARPGDRILVAPGDKARAEAIARELDVLAPGLQLAWSDEPADELDRGVLVKGDRVRSVVSPESAVEAMKSELEVRFSNELFGNGEA